MTDIRFKIVLTEDYNEHVGYLHISVNVGRAKCKIMIPANEIDYDEWSEIPHYCPINCKDIALEFGAQGTINITAGIIR